jgi:protein-S-isoprenylcysteine O-methyltransferase Ste14
MLLSVAWLLRRADRDYEKLGRLSSRASLVAWVLYTLHAGLTLAASGDQRPRGPGVTSLLGVALFVAAVREHRSLRQVSGLTAERLVTSGPYRFTRNPQIVGWGLALSGVAFRGRSPKALALVAGFVAAHRLYAPVEERHLERTFGAEYRRYRGEVPRFLGLPGAG